MDKKSEEELLKSYGLDCVQNLYTSLDNLEKSVDSARKEYNNEKLSQYLYRFEAYSEIIEKQRKFCEEVISTIKEKDWTEMFRYINLIVELSLMIKDDAKDLAKEQIKKLKKG